LEQQIMADDVQGRRNHRRSSAAVDEEVNLPDNYELAGMIW
jgi:hypothetical protein